MTLTQAQILTLAEKLEGFTADAVLEVLGLPAWRALARNETTPGLLATQGGSRIDVLTRLFSLQGTTDLATAQRIFGDLLGPLLEARILGLRDDRVNALVDIRPYGDDDHDWWVVSDLTPGLNGIPSPVRADFVLGISEASSSLARLTARRPVNRALDLGTGCGVQALHLSTHAQQVVATDVNQRALTLAKLTAALNNVDIDFREGSLYEPVDEAFDLIVTNPPFVVSPNEGERLVYRETGFAADDIVKHVVTGAADHLTPDGMCQVLAAWIEPEDQPWDERLAEWIEPTGLDAWVIRRESVDLPEYTEMWLADSGLPRGPEFTRRYEHWLGWFEAQGIASMGFGWINLHKSERDQPQIRIEENVDPVREPVGTEFAVWPDRIELLAGGNVLDSYWKVAADVVEETISRPGASDPNTISLRRTTGLAPTARLDTVTAGFISACDGELTARQILESIASILGLDPEELNRQYEPIVSDLIRDGFIVSG